MQVSSESFQLSECTGGWPDIDTDHTLSLTHTHTLLLIIFVPIQLRPKNKEVTSKKISTRGIPLKNDLQCESCRGFLTLIHHLYVFFHLFIYLFGFRSGHQHLSHVISFPRWAACTSSFFSFFAASLCSLFVRLFFPLSNSLN